VIRIRPVRVGSFLDDARLTEQGAQRAVRIGTTTLEGLVAAGAPVDTGFLKASVQGRAESSTRGVVTVGAEYGAYVNYGTRHQRAQPFFDDAIVAFRPMWREIVRREALR
jgi:HK97 gp10 family phage protein